MPVIQNFSQNITLLINQILTDKIKKDKETQKKLLTLLYKHFVDPISLSSLDHIIDLSMIIENIEPLEKLIQLQIKNLTKEHIHTFKVRFPAEQALRLLNYALTFDPKNENLHKECILLTTAANKISEALEHHTILLEKELLEPKYELILERENTLKKIQSNLKDEKDINATTIKLLLNKIHQNDFYQKERDNRKKQNIQNFNNSVDKIFYNRELPPILAIIKLTMLEPEENKSYLKERLSKYVIGRLSDNEYDYINKSVLLREVLENIAYAKNNYSEYYQTLCESVLDSLKTITDYNEKRLNFYNLFIKMNPQKKYIDIWNEVVHKIIKSNNNQKNYMAHMRLINKLFNQNRNTSGRDMLHLDINVSTLNDNNLSLLQQVKDFCDALYYVDDSGHYNRDATYTKHHKDRAAENHVIDLIFYAQQLTKSNNNQEIDLFLYIHALFIFKSKFILHSEVKLLKEKTETLIKQSSHPDIMKLKELVNEFKPDIDFKTGNEKELDSMIVAMIAKNDIALAAKYTFILGKLTTVQTPTWEDQRYIKKLSDLEKANLKRLAKQMDSKEKLKALPLELQNLMFLMKDKYKQADAKTSLDIENKINESITKIKTHSNETYPSIEYWHSFINETLNEISDAADNNFLAHLYNEFLNSILPSLIEGENNKSNLKRFALSLHYTLIEKISISSNFRELINRGLELFLKDLEPEDAINNFNLKTILSIYFVSTENAKIIKGILLNQEINNKKMVDYSYEMRKSIVAMQFLINSLPIKTQPTNSIISTDLFFLSFRLLFVLKSQYTVDNIKDNSKLFEHTAQQVALYLNHRNHGDKKNNVTVLETDLKKNILMETNEPNIDSLVVKIIFQFFQNTQLAADYIFSILTIWDQNKNKKKDIFTEDKLDIFTQKLSQPEKSELLVLLHKKIDVEVEKERIIERDNFIADCLKQVSKVVITIPQDNLKIYNIQNLLQGFNFLPQDKDIVEEATRKINIGIENDRVRKRDNFIADHLANISEQIRIHHTDNLYIYNMHHLLKDFVFLPQDKDIIEKTITQLVDRWKESYKKSKFEINFPINLFSSPKNREYVLFFYHLIKDELKNKNNQYFIRCFFSGISPKELPQEWNEMLRMIIIPYSHTEFTFSLMSETTVIERRKIYLQEKNGFIAYTVRNTQHDIVSKITDFKAPTPFNLQELKRFVYQIQTIVEKSGDAITRRNPYMMNSINYSHDSTTSGGDALYANYGYLINDTLRYVFNLANFQNNWQMWPGRDRTLSSESQQLLNKSLYLLKSIRYIYLDRRQPKISLDEIKKDAKTSIYALHSLIQLYEKSQPKTALLLSMRLLILLNMHPLEKLYGDYEIKEYALQYIQGHAKQLSDEKSQILNAHTITNQQAAVAMLKIIAEVKPTEGNLDSEIINKLAEDSELLSQNIWIACDYMTMLSEILNITDTKNHTFTVDKYELIKTYTEINKFNESIATNLELKTAQILFNLITKFNTSKQSFIISIGIAHWAQHLFNKIDAQTTLLTETNDYRAALQLFYSLNTNEDLFSIWPTLDHLLSQSKNPITQENRLLLLEDYILLSKESLLRNKPIKEYIKLKYPEKSFPDEIFDTQPNVLFIASASAMPINRSGLASLLNDLVDKDGNPLLNTNQLSQNSDHKPVLELNVTKPIATSDSKQDNNFPKIPHLAGFFTGKEPSKQLPDQQPKQSDAKLLSLTQG